MGQFTRLLEQITLTAWWDQTPLESFSQNSVFRIQGPGISFVPSWQRMEDGRFLFIPQEVEITDMIYLIWLLEMTSGSVND